MDKDTAKKRLDTLHTKLLEDVLYTELVTEGRGFVDNHLFLIEKDSGGEWDKEIAAERVKLLEDTALIPPEPLRE